MTTFTGIRVALLNARKCGALALWDARASVFRGLTLVWGFTHAEYKQVRYGHFHSNGSLITLQTSPNWRTESSSAFAIGYSISKHGLNYFYLGFSSGDRRKGVRGTRR